MHFSFTAGTILTVLPEPPLVMNNGPIFSNDPASAIYCAPVQETGPAPVPWECEHACAEGTSVTLSAPGSSVYWGGDCGSIGSTAADCTLVMDTDKRVTAGEVCGAP